LETIEALFNSLADTLDAINADTADAGRRKVACQIWPECGGCAAGVSAILGDLPLASSNALTGLAQCGRELDTAKWRFHDTYVAAQARQSCAAAPALFVTPLDRAASLLNCLAAGIVALLPAARGEAEQLEAAAAALRAGRATVDDRGAVVLLPDPAGDSSGGRRGA